MTDDLRTRIAAVLYTRAMSRLSWHRDWEDLHPDVQQLWLDDADAVIEELKLRIEWGALDPDHNGTLAETRDELAVWAGETIHHRYITDWKADDD